MRRFALPWRMGPCRHGAEEAVPGGCIALTGRASSPRAGVQQGGSQAKADHLPALRTDRNPCLLLLSSHGAQQVHA